MTSCGRWLLASSHGERWSTMPAIPTLCTRLPATACCSGGEHWTAQPECSCIADAVGWRVGWSTACQVMALHGRSWHCMPGHGVFVQQLSCICHQLTAHAATAFSSFAGRCAPSSQERRSPHPTQSLRPRAGSGGASCCVTTTLTLMLQLWMAWHRQLQPARRLGTAAKHQKQQAAQWRQAAVAAQLRAVRQQRPYSASQISHPLLCCRWRRALLSCGCTAASCRPGRTTSGMQR